MTIFASELANYINSINTSRGTRSTKVWNDNNSVTLHGPKGNKTIKLSNKLSEDDIKGYIIEAETLHSIVEHYLKDPNGTVYSGDGSYKNWIDASITSDRPDVNINKTLYRNYLNILDQIKQDYRDNAACKECYSGCTTGCNTGACKDDCTEKCSNGCHGCSGCSGGDWCHGCGNCNGCNDDCYSKCSSCNSGCKDGCNSECLGTCYSSCNSSCVRDCENTSRIGNYTYDRFRIYNFHITEGHE
jgi:hypothetical protein